MQFILDLVDKISGPAKQAAGATDKLTQSLKNAQGAADGATKGNFQLFQSFIDVKAAAEVAIGILKEVTGAAIGAAQFAAEAADFKGDTLDALEQMTGSAEAAQATWENINKIGNKLGISRASLVESTNKLVLAGVEDQGELTSALETIANIGSVKGLSPEKFESIIQKSMSSGKFEVSTKALQGTGAKLTDVYEELGQRMGIGSKQVEEMIKKGQIKAGAGLDALKSVINKKLGGIAGKQALDLENQFTRMKDNLAKLFEDVNTGPFLEALSDMLSIFDQSTESGKTLKFLAETIFQGLFDTSKVVLPYVKDGFLRIENAVLRVYIAAQPVIKQLNDMFKNTDSADIKMMLQSVADLIEFVGMVVVKSVEYWILFQTTVFGAISSVGTAIGTFVAHVVNGFNIVKGIAEAFIVDFTSIGSRMIDGLVQGILGGATKAADAVKGVAQGAVNAVVGVLGIHSPSKVFAELGGHTAAGFAEGVDSGAPAAQSAMGDMVAPPVSPKGGGGSMTMDVGGVSITINGVQGADQLAEVLPQQIALVFEQLALQMAGAPG